MNDMGQTIKNAKGVTAFVVLTPKEYADLVSAAEDAAAAADATAVRAALANPGDLVPGEVADRIFAGENRIHVWRTHRSMTQGDLAKAVGISQAAVSLIEAGKQTPTAPVLRAIADALGVRLDALA